MSKRLSLGLVGIALGAVLLGAACNESTNPRLIAATPTPPQTPTIESAPTATPELARPATPTPVIGDYDPVVTMQKLFSGPSHSFQVTLDGLSDAFRNGDTSQVKPILEVMRFAADSSIYQAFPEVLSELTGQPVGPDMDDWGEWVSARLDQFPPPPGYLEWKISLLGLVSSRYQDFLGSADETSRIDIFELV